MKTRNKILREKLAALPVLMAALCPVTAFASAFEDSNIAKGTIRLINDLTSWLTLLGPVAGGLFAIYFLIRKGAADEMDQKMWQKRFNTAVICGVGTMLVSGIIALITSYYSS